MKHRLKHLDLLRGLAAIVVAAGHVRGFMMVEYQQLNHPNPLLQVFYFLTGLGHQAVVLFFVLSGYLVGGSVWDAFRAGTFSWAEYALRRLTRLWIALIPALMLTYAWDMAGMAINSNGYSGKYSHVYNFGPRQDVPHDLRLTTFLGNVAFLQTIKVAWYGTNGPLWSLANEFWYYVLFPLIMGIFCSRSVVSRVSSAALSIILICWLPRGILLGGLIWLGGVVASIACRKPLIRYLMGRPIVLLTSIVLTMCALVMATYDERFNNDLFVGVFFVFLVMAAVSTEYRIVRFQSVILFVSEFSYTLYIVHFPFIAFIVFSFFNGNRFQPSVSIFLLYGFILMLMIGYAILLWWIFERNTVRVRKWMSRQLFSIKKDEINGSSPST